MSTPTPSSVRTAGAAAVSPHHLASRAALEVIAAGGNAVDGAVAANAVLGAVLPTTCGIGGDLFALISMPDEPVPAALNASGRGGSGLDPAAIRSQGHRSMPLGEAWAITVPGCVDGWAALSSRYGRFALPRLLESSIRQARDGFGVSPELAAALKRLEPSIAAQPSAPELYPGGRVPDAGETLHRPRYAEALELIADEGRDGFYAGPVGEAIVRATAGVVTADDLARPQAEWVDPIGIDVFGHRAWTVPPNSQGYLTLAACWLFEQLAPPDDPLDPGFHHAAIEAYRASAWEAAGLVADPDRAPLSPLELLDPARLEPRLESIRTDRTAEWPSPRPAPGGTAYLCVVDDAGMGVSLIQSNFTGLGSGISAGSTGVWLHNRGAGFSLVPGHINEAAPQRRPFHTLSPTLWTRHGSLAMLLGTRGAHQQPQYLAQMAALLLHAGLTPEAAQLVPRWHIAEDPVVEIESRADDRLVDGLASRGHPVRRAPDWPPGWGPVSAITVAESGERTGCADPRVSTATAAS